MKITNINIISNRYPLVTVEADNGTTGIGATSASVAGVRGVMEDQEGGLRQLLLGEDPTNTNSLWRKMYYGHSYESS